MKPNVFRLREVYCMTKNEVTNLKPPYSPLAALLEGFLMVYDISFLKRSSVSNSFNPRVNNCSRSMAALESKPV